MANGELRLVVLRSSDVERDRGIYEALGVRWVAERHGAGPAHLAATLASAVVLELYPAGDRQPTDVRLGFAVDDLMEAVEAVQRAGGSVITWPEPEDDPERAVVADHDGRRIELTRRST